MELESRSKINQFYLFNISIVFLQLYEDVIRFNVRVNDTKSTQYVEYLCYFDY